jgi:hypothetical protein
MEMLAEMTADSNCTQPKKTLPPKLVTELGTITDRSPVYENANASMRVTELGIVRYARLEQPSRAWSPMVVTDDGITRVTRLVQNRKA